MKNQDRRSLVRVLSDEDYLDVMAVCSSFPHIHLTTETQGKAQLAFVMVWSWVVVFM